jgi:hypothetical protein
MRGKSNCGSPGLVGFKVLGFAIAAESKSAEQSSRARRQTFERVGIANPKLKKRKPAKFALSRVNCSTQEKAKLAISEAAAEVLFT